MKDMKLSPEIAKEMNQPVKSEAPAYPYGLCIRLDEESIKKLGLKELPSVGAKLNLKAVVEVTEISSHESQNSEHRSIGLQITSMDIGKSKKEIDIDKLYNKKK